MTNEDKIESLFKFVELRFGITPEQIRVRGKKGSNARIIDVRRAIAVIAHQWLGYTLDAAAKLVGKADHSQTVWYKETHSHLIEASAAYRIVFNALMEHLEELSPVDSRVINVDNLRDRIYKYIGNP
jgi:hypothetical protein